MGYLINHQTEKGEITINLNLTIKVEQDKVVVGVEKAVEVPEKKEYFIPEFSAEKLVEKFGHESGGE